MKNTPIFAEETIQEAKLKLPDRVYSKELIELLFEQPYCKIKFLVDKGITQRQTAGDYLDELENVGNIKSKKSGRKRFTSTKPYTTYGQFIIHVDDIN